MTPDGALERAVVVKPVAMMLCFLLSTTKNAHIGLRLQHILP